MISGPNIHDEDVKKNRAGSERSPIQERELITFSYLPCVEDQGYHIHILQKHGVLQNLRGHLPAERLRCHMLTGKIELVPGLHQSESHGEGGGVAPCRLPASEGWNAVPMVRDSIANSIRNRTVAISAWYSETVLCMAYSRGWPLLLRS